MIYIIKSILSKMSKYRSFCRYILLLSIFTVIFFYGFRNWNEFRNMEFKLQIVNVFSGFLLTVAAYLMLPYLWGLLLEKCSIQLSYRESFRILFTSALAQYIPVKGMHIAGRIVLAREKKIPVKGLSGSIVLEIYYSLIGSLLFVPFAFYNRLPLLMVAIILVLICSIYFLGYKFLFIMPLLAKRIFKEKTNYWGTITFPENIKIATGYSVAQFTMGCGFYLIFSNFLTVTIPEVIIIIGAYIVAWLLGILSIIFPKGFGVREAGIVMLLGNIFGTHIIVAAALLHRLITVLVDLLFGSLAVLTRMDKSSIE